MNKQTAKDLHIRALRLRAELQLLQGEARLTDRDYLAHLLNPADRPLGEFISQTFLAFLEGEP